MKFNKTTPCLIWISIFVKRMGLRCLFLKNNICAGDIANRGNIHINKVGIKR